MGFLACFIRNRITLLKILIIIVDLYYFVAIGFQLATFLFKDVFNIITLTYLIIILIFNLISEFSPYLLQNYFLFIFPFLSNYYGRGVVYILIGIVSISPELIIYLNYGGYMFLGIGILCIYINCLINKDFQIEYQDFEVMKENYQDFSDDSQRESLTFPKLNNDYNNENNNNNEVNTCINKYDNKKQSIEMKEMQK